MARTNKFAATAVAAAFLGQACVNGGTRLTATSTVGGGSGGPPPTAQQKQLAAATPQKPLASTEMQKTTDAAIERWFNTYPTRRAYLQLDKPLYQPGEVVWFRAHMRNTRDLIAMAGVGLTMQLLSPKGAVVAQKRVMLQDGVGANDFELPGDAQGGEYILQMLADDGTQEKHTFIVNSYDAPRLKKTLELLRKAYSPGDEVTAAVAVARGTGEPFANRKVTAVVTVDDNEVVRKDFTTDAQGNVMVKFALPAKIAREDGLLTILADDGGLVESISKRIPITLATVNFALFPEGGDLVEGLPGRVYFAASNTIGKPADVAGRVLDDQGKQVASFESIHDGMGRFEITPQKGRKYHVELDKPTGSKQKIELPKAVDKGCSLQAVDDFESKDDELRVAAWCSEPKTVLVEAVLREKRLASAGYELVARQPTLISLPVNRSEQGAVRVTLFDDAQAPLAERLVYRGRRADMKVTITADKKTYSPRDPVTLTVKTTDLAGKPVQASLGLSVVDDTVLSFADDKTANLLTRLYLEPELGTDPVEEPNFYFSDKPEAGASMDLLMGTRGWRRFQWAAVFAPPAPPPMAYPAGRAMDDAEMAVPMAAPPPEAPMPAEKAPAMRKNAVRAPAKPAAPRAAAPRPEPKPVMAVRAHADKKAMKEEKPREERKRDLAAQQPGRGPAMGRAKMRPNVGGRGGGAGGAEAGVMAKDEDWGGDVDGAGNWNYVPVRVFPVPQYKKGEAGPRTDFRETIYWAHDVRTGKDGSAQVKFVVSDAVTSFRAVAEGVSQGGLPGRGDAVVQSKLPVSLDVRMPTEVSQGDKLELPVTLTNETDRSITANVQAAFGPSFKIGANPFAKPITLGAHEKKAFFFPLTVVGKGGEGDAQISMQAEGLKDEIHKTIRVVPLGFPFEVGASGTVKGSAKEELDLSGAMPGSITAKVIMYPTPLASMTQGMAAMVREPGGCFEQTSATNYPNIMVMNYLQQNNAADPALVADASGKLARGYKLLTGYETKEKGYEWFGENPGHEALTAYGLMEFKDMAQVWDDVDRAMVERTADWLMKRRDGKGGYERNAKALDSFGRANYETTALYITWALSEAGRAKGLDKELAFARKHGLESKDPYHVALAANTLLNVDAGAPETKKVVARLAEMQDKDGGFPGATQSITMSGGDSLAIETTALGTLALVKASKNGEYEAPLRKSVEWMNAHRGGYGEWGNTQGTVLGLKALSAYTEHSRQTQSSGVARVIVNGKEVGKVAFQKGRKEEIEFDDLAAALTPGKNTIEVKLDSQASMPYSIAVEYRSARPQSSAKATIGVETELAKKNVKMGEGVKLRAKISNKTDKGQPMTLARLGLPGGLSFQTWQLKELRDKKIIGFYETRQREVILYFRDMKPGQTVDVALDLVATVPGAYVAPASSAYLYYTDEDKSWSPPLEVTVSK
jgi:alpha-2-macroglobulin-like protein